MRISRWTRRILVIATGLLALGLAAPVQADTDVVGRVGTTRLDDGCGDGLVIGLDYMRGKAMDSIGVVCGTFANGSGPGEVKNLGRHGGGGGDGPLTTRCPADQAVAGANIYTDKFGAIRHIVMSCFPIGGTEVTEVNTSTNGGEDKMQQRADCPPGQFATGILGGATDLVDRLGFHCGAPPVAAAATKSRGLGILLDAIGAALPVEMIYSDYSSCANRRRSALMRASSAAGAIRRIVGRLASA